MSQDAVNCDGETSASSEDLTVMTPGLWQHVSNYNNINSNNT